MTKFEKLESLPDDVVWSLWIRTFGRKVWVKGTGGDPYFPYWTYRNGRYCDKLFSNHSVMVEID